MTLAFRDRRIVPATPEAVWATLTDWARGPEWLPEVERMTADAPSAVGTVLRFTARGAERTSTITALDPGRSITLTSEQPGVRADYTYTVIAEGAGAAIELEADVVTSGAMKLLGPVIRSAIAKADSVQLGRLAALL